MNTYPPSYVLGLIVGVPIAIVTVVAVITLLIDIVSYGISEGIMWLFVVYAFISPLALPVCGATAYLLHRGIPKQEAALGRKVNHLVKFIYWSVVAASLFFAILFTMLLVVNLL